jgi:DNA-binding CsgD family transcriptional regulator
MQKPSKPKADLEAGREDERSEVGHFVLGGRLFVIALASQSSNEGAAAQRCSFEIDGECLVALERKDSRTPRDNNPVTEIANRLSGRELEIAVLVAQGNANKVIAHRLQISEWTVATYLRRIFAKLDVISRAAMVYRCAPLINLTIDACLLALRSKPEDARREERNDGETVLPVRRRGAGLGFPRDAKGGRRSH